MAKHMPIMLSTFMASSALQQHQQSIHTDPPATLNAPNDPSLPLRSEKFYVKESSTTIPEDLLELSRTAFSTALSKEKWAELSQSYPSIRDTESFLVSPRLEASMKEALRKQHGNLKTKDILSFDEGLAEQQAPFVMVARPLLAALTALDAPGEEGEGPDPDTIKDYLEDALVLLGNAHVRLNNWRQRRFNEFLTDLGKRTLKEGIPTDKHLFPDKFHEKIRVEHDHSSTTRKLISTPAVKPSFIRPTHQPRFQPFRGNSNKRTADETHKQSRRSWSHTRTGHTQSKRPRPSNPQTQPIQGSTSSQL